jgi:hypothetical protein
MRASVAFSDDVASLLCESPEGCAIHKGEVCAEVCLAVLYLRPHPFYYNRILHAWLSGEGA